MIQRVIKKLLMMIPIVFVVSVILFWLLSCLPGDAASAKAGVETSSEEIEAMRQELGLDVPIYVQYWDWMSGVLKGDFGTSLISGASITEKIQLRFPVTIELALLSMLVAILIAIPLGIISAVYRNSALDSTASVLSMIGIAMPSFWLGMLLIMLFSLGLKWRPASGFTSMAENLGQNLKGMIMPAVAIGTSFAATTMRQTRNAMLEVLDQDYMVTAKAKGLPGGIMIWKHALRNALIPVVTVIAMQLGKLFGGAVVCETVFAIPGLGREIVNSILTRDYPITMACVMCVALIVIFINTFIDIIYGFIDPRVLQEGKR